jgi:uncharacterized protein YndB with AHSA1/START domain
MSDLVAEATMLIRTPVEEVFRAIVDPEVTTRFWFTTSTGPLEPGAHVRWGWEPTEFAADVEVLDVRENGRVLVRWTAYGAPTEIEWVLAESPHGTVVTVENRGFADDGHAVDAAAGFAFVLAGMKALLEHGLELGLVRDRLLLIAG